MQKCSGSRGHCNCNTSSAILRGST